MIRRERRRASQHSERETQVMIAGISKVDGSTIVGRRADNLAAPRGDIRDATLRVGDQLDKHKRVNPTG